MTSRRSKRWRWRDIGCIAGLILLIGLVGVIVRIFQVAAQLAQDSLHPPRAPIMLTPTDVGIAHYQDVAFPTSDGLTIRGWLIPGWNRALVILGHGNGNNRAGLLPEAAILAGHGYAVLMFDWRAEGESDGQMVSFGQFETRDLRGAVDFALSQPGVDPARIGGLGFSMGGSAMTLGAAQDDRIKAVIVEDSFTTLDEVAAYRTSGIPFLGPLAVVIGQQQAGVDASAVRPIDSICRISPRPVLLIYGAQDDYIPPGSADRMFAAACQPKDLWLVPGAGHGGFTQVDPVEYAAHILAFFDQNLLR